MKTAHIGSGAANRFGKPAGVASRGTDGGVLTAQWSRIWEIRPFVGSFFRLREMRPDSCFPGEESGAGE